jgi:hypothetical protein
VELNVKNMVCGRCLKIVKQIIDKHQLKIRAIELGKVLIEGNVSMSEIEGLRKDLQQEGFDLIDDQKAKLVEPLILVFSFIRGIATITSFQTGEFHLMTLMNNFMGGFFIAFSFFKFLT